jgi:Immunity protein 50
MDFADRIVGAEKLVALFGYWPSFHDAEVKCITLDRQPRDESHGPILEALIHAFEMTRDVGPDGFFVLRHHVLVRMRFSQVAELQLTGFNYQNALFELEISDLRELQLEHIQFDVRFNSSHGVDASFQCRAIEVVEVTQCDRHGEPLPG